MSTNHILNHTLAKEVARQVVELAAVKTELAEERKKCEEAEKKLKERPFQIHRMEPREFQDFHAKRSLSALASQQAAAINQYALGAQGYRQNNYAFGIGGAANGIFG